MGEERTICNVCAWRADCIKKFSFDMSSMKCPDYTRDLTIKEPKEEPEKKGS